MSPGFRGDELMNKFKKVKLQKVQLKKVTR